jgi:hypothetical protein
MQTELRQVLPISELAKQKRTVSVEHVQRVANSELMSAIEKDSRDPQFMANLSALGQVKVDHHMATFQTVSRIGIALRTPWINTFLRTHE